ncbi:phasin family protein [Candidatus Uabimicrobium sp. HlEnr_7]|uniref:phasin family protein n=1 Tax=Candidatus Uabimicrobium helgolandensis TaxID=3095367 RepID=UPI0035564F36
MNTTHNITQNKQNISQKLLQKSCEVQQNFKRQLKHLGLATLGALSICQEQAQQKMKQFINKGSETEKDLSEWTNHMLKKGYRETKETISDVEKTLEVSNLLKKMNIPSKNDVENLSKKVDELSKKIDEIIVASTNKEQTINTAQTSHVSQVPSSAE